MKKINKYISTLTLITIIIYIFTFNKSLATSSESYIWTTDTIETNANITSNTANNTTTNTTNNTTTSNATTNQTANTTQTATEPENENSLNLESGSAILIEQTTGQILYSHNIHEQLRPASVTKVMSILLIMEAISNQQISLTDNVPCSENASSMGGSQIWLDPRETLTVDEMLKAICVNSANDYNVQK